MVTRQPPTQPPTTVRRIEAADPAVLAELAEVLIDCVEGGASVSFMLPIDRRRIDAFWAAAAEAVADGRRILLVAEDGHGVVGTVQLILDLPENQPHRADVAKMLVHRRARRRGVGAKLLEAAEREAAAAGRNLLVLDTVTGGDAERLYLRCGWIRVGDIPDFALFPDGELCGTTVFYRRIGTDTGTGTGTGQ